jgi:voltage-gated potassium channel
MFWLAFVFLLLMAGLLHRYSRPELTQFERGVIEYGVLLLWPGIAIEACVRFLLRDPAQGRTRPALRTLLVVLLPPFRMGLANHTAGVPQLWLPGLGWQPVDKALARRLDRGFGVPMIFFAFLILPLLVLEYAWADRVRTSPGLALFLHVGISVVWVAFALELILKVSVAPRALTYLKERWLDVAIVTIPLFEFALSTLADAAPLARLLRLSRALQPEQLGRMSQLYRLRGLAIKAWHAVMLLEVIARVTGHTLEKRLKHLEDQLAMKEQELAELREEVEGVRRKIDEEKRAEVGAMLPF